MKYFVSHMLNIIINTLCLCGQIFIFNPNRNIYEYYNKYDREASEMNKKLRKFEKKSAFFSQKRGAFKLDKYPITLDILLSRTAQAKREV
jgi:hypothetical protein